jgi:hypothetical protein
MEHLFFHASDERVLLEVSSAQFSDILERDWVALARNTEVMPHVRPTTEWLGFEHNRGGVKNCYRCNMISTCILKSEGGTCSRPGTMEISGRHILPFKISALRQPLLGDVSLLCSKAGSTLGF